jgi:molybdopterin-guanine dinucleotide biosynthesis protein A
MVVITILLGGGESSFARMTNAYPKLPTNPYQYYNQNMLSIVIQAGGESRRMGQDKALRPFLGQPLIQRVINRLAPIATELLVTTNNPDAYRFLNLPLASDPIPGRGALGGLYTALYAAHNPLVGVVACDMPFANPDLLRAASDMLTQNPNLGAVIPRLEHGSEPFHSVYRRERCLPYVEEALKNDRWRVDAWFPQVEIHFLTPVEIAIYDPDQLAFQNVNTPQEWEQAEALASNTQA